MTVLTFPSTGTKADKVPLVDDVDSKNQATEGSPRSIPPSSFHPKQIESGEAGLLRDASIPIVGASNEFPKKQIRATMLFRVTRTMILLLLLGAVVMYSSNFLCKALKKDSKLQIEKIQEQKDGDIRDSSRLYKSYTSYADAESEMFSMPPSSPTDNDYDQRLGLDPMEDVYKKLSDIAVNKGMVDQKKNIPDVISVLNSNFEMNHKDSDVSPPLVISKSARFIHDFSINITAIVDIEGQRCYVMPIFRKALSPPISLYDLLFKMSSGYYSTDLKKSMHNMRVIEPAVTDLSAYGLYISKDCADYSTFKLEKVETTTDV
ncbi:BRICHOS domain [Cinara cedri]|uniref:Integral membrane protein 2 n=1 Tax=Cinara cedri TaxID=506608 RepID=A0A5E4NHK8_9HEMI|nr:BRICHOS domain [Cinara cedri]